MAMCLHHGAPSRSDTLRDSTTNNEVFDDGTDLRRIREMAVCFHHAARMLDVWSLVTPRLARRVAFFAGSLFVLLPALASGQSTGVTAIWDASPHSDQVSDYEVCIGTSSLSCNIHRVMVTTRLLMRSRPRPANWCTSRSGRATTGAEAPIRRNTSSRFPRSLCRRITAPRSKPRSRRST